VFFDGNNIVDQRSISRRDVLRVAAGGLAASSIRPSHLLADANEGLLIIDCHAHIYGQDEQRYPTIEEPYRPPEGKGTIEHLRTEMQAAGVRYVTAIQTSTFYRFDNRFTADSARKHGDFMAAVCTLDPDDAGSPALLEQYVRESNVRGMRSIPAANGRLDDLGVDALWTSAEQMGIVINVLVGRDKRPEIESLVRRHPKLNVVIDHCLNPKAGPTLQPTLDDMLALSRHPTIHAKLSFVPTGSAEEFPCADMHAACRAIIDEFGPERCVWGSDFPCELWCPKVTYRQHLDIFRHELGLDASTQMAVLGETARRLWFGEHS